MVPTNQVSYVVNGDESRELGVSGTGIPGTESPGISTTLVETMKRIDETKIELCTRYFF